MTQNQLDRLIAQTTGDDIRDIRRLGFSLADPHDTDFDPEPDNLSPQEIDWDLLDQERQCAFIEPPSYRPAAA